MKFYFKNQAYFDMRTNSFFGGETESKIGLRLEKRSWVGIGLVAQFKGELKYTQDHHFKKSPL